MADGQQPIPIPPSGQPLVDPNDFVYQVSTAPQVNDQSVVPSDVTGSLPTLTPQVPPAWMPAQNVLANPELHAAAVHHARLASSIGNAVSEMMSGGEGQQLHILRRPDGSYMVQAQPMTQGQRWARVAAAALSGAAQGFAVGQGPGGPGRAAAAGLQAGMQIGQGNQDQTLNLAERMNKQDRDAQLFKANMTLLNQHAVQGAFNLHQAQIKATEDEQDRQDRIHQSMIAAHATHLFIPSDGNPNTLMDRVAQQINSNPELTQAHTDGRTSVFTSYDKDGNPNGVDVYSIPVDKMKQLTTQPYDRYVTRLNDAGTKLEQKLIASIPAGGMEEGQKMAMMASDEVANNKTKLDFQKTEGELAQRKVELEQQKIQASLLRGQLSASEKETFQPMAVQDPNTGQTVIKAVGNRGTVKDFAGEGIAPGQTLSKIGANAAADQKAMLALDKTYLKPARDAERANLLFNQAYQDHLRGVPTGAQSMLALSQHLATTFGNVKGSRITRDMISEHLGARSISDDALVAVQRLTNGDVLSPNQWKAFRQMIGNARNSSWQEASDAAVGLRVDPNRFLPADLQNTATAQGYHGAGPLLAPGAVQPPAATSGPTGPTGNVGQAARQPGGPGIRLSNTPPPAGRVWVQIPGAAVGSIPADQVSAFLKTHPNAVVQQP